ncbi:MAG: glycosyltransferase [Clostridiales bacterium]|nr:glycosyltransferase [Clostridiales bacterium]
MESVKVSIITPCYNVEQYIGECLDSVLSQSLGDIEMICIDDGSTDSTRKILEDYKAKDPRIVIIEQENSGPSVGRNAAMDIARGEYISFVDSDDLMAEGALEKCYVLAHEYATDVVHFNADTFFDSPEFKEQFKLYEEQGQRDLANNNYIRSGYEKYNSKGTPTDGPTLFSAMYPAGTYRPPIWLCFFRGAFLKEHGFRFIKGILHADDPFTFETILSAKSVAFCDDVLYRRRFRPDSIMTTPFGRRNAVSRIIGQKKMLGFLDSIAPALSEDALRVAMHYLNYRRKIIEENYMKFLSEEEEADLEYINLLASLPIYGQPSGGQGSTSFSSRVKNKLKRTFKRG